MNFRDYYREYLDNEDTRFFILDSNGPAHTDEVDFEYYYWHTNKFGKLRTNDLFVYRRPTRGSEYNEFYFFGSGRISEIIVANEESTLVKGLVSNGLIFSKYIFKDDLEEIEWEFKEKNRSDWKNFFNQYGMTKITKSDFLNLLDIQEEYFKITTSDRDEESSSPEVEVNLFNQQQNNDYRVENNQAIVNVRGSAQKIFSNAVKSNYKYQCCITGIKTKPFLIASHIIPWSEDENNRLNPDNGLCLEVLIDKAFDKGYISFDEDFKLIISPKAEEDPLLLEKLIVYNGQKINTHGGKFPNSDFLAWHRENVFLQD